MNRRELLQLLGGAVALGTPARLMACAAGDKLGKIGVQLYTVRSLMAQNVEDTLRRVAEIGYQEVEFAGLFNRTPSAMRATLDSLGLAAPSTHIDVREIAPERISQQLDTANTLGNRYLVVAFLAPELRRTLDDWKRVAARFNAAGEAAKARGIQFAYHNHDFEFVPIDGQVPFDVLLQASDPSLVRIELDLYWITKAGGDPAAYFNRWPARFPMVHVKDSAGPPDHQMRDVGAGVLPFAQLFAQRQKAGIEHFFVEHDNPKQPLDSIRASFDHLRRLTF